MKRVYYYHFPGGPGGIFGASPYGQIMIRDLADGGKETYSEYLTDIELLILLLNELAKDPRCNKNDIARAKAEIQRKLGKK
ncbi:MAG: hypothetical protein PHD72_01145 [Patescibacteria group bacterium]|nr:hypothetical protein [Patescibacteria group bacterium]